MRRYRGVILLAVLVVIAAGCSNNDDNAGSSGATGGGASGQSENIGTVNVLSALDPSEARSDAEGLRRQDQLADATTRPRSRRTATSSRMSRSGPRPERSTSSLLPQPGAVVEQAEVGQRRLARGHGLQHRRSQRDVRRVLHVARRVQRQALRHPDEHQPQEHGLVPEGRLRRGGLQGAEDVGRDVGAVATRSSPTAERRGASGSRARAPPDGPRPTGSKTSCFGPPGLDTYDKWATHEIPFNDPSVLNAAKIFGNIMFHPGLRARWRRRRPRRSRSATRRCRCSTSRRAAGCTVRRTSSTRSSPRRRRPGVDYDWFPLPPIDQDGTLFAGELAVARSATRRRSRTS